MRELGIPSDCARSWVERNPTVPAGGIYEQARGGYRGYFYYRTEPDSQFGYTLLGPWERIKRKACSYLLVEHAYETTLLDRITAHLHAIQFTDEELTKYEYCLGRISNVVKEWRKRGRGGFDFTPSPPSLTPLSSPAALIPTPLPPPKPIKLFEGTPPSPGRCKRVSKVVRSPKTTESAPPKPPREARFLIEQEERRRRSFGTLSELFGKNMEQEGVPLTRTVSAPATDGPISSLFRGERRRGGERVKCAFSPVPSSCRSGASSPVSPGGSTPSC